jgi:hypothetical protein
MGSSITALVLGTGKFGRHYAKILSVLNERELTGVPRIEKLIVSKTRLDSARNLAESLRQNSHCAVDEVSGVKISNRDHLRQLMERQAIQFFAITARDKQCGDTVHALYAVETLKYGTVLCEKPFCNADGDGSSLKYFRDLTTCRNSKRFGLELPLAIVAGKLMQDQYFRERLLHASHIGFYWEAPDRGDSNVIDDLVLHPWSLIPPQFKTRVIDIQGQGQRADIHLQLHNRHNRHTITCRIELRTGGNFRGMMIDDFAFSVRTEDSRLKLVKIKDSLRDASSQPDKSITKKVLLEVDNPLEQHIVAALKGQPIVGLTRAYESQLFLEELHGYKGP